MSKRYTKSQRDRLTRYYITCLMLMNRKDENRVLAWGEIVFGFVLISTIAIMTYSFWGMWKG